MRPTTDALDAWRRLRELEGARATIIDLYELVAMQRGLAAHQLPGEERLALARSAMPHVWPGFAATQDSERSGDAIRVVDADPEWPAKFQSWRFRLRDCLGDVAQRIEHIGSTSVPDLPAKPVIDIQVSVLDPEDESYVSPLERAGLQLRSRDALHRYFRPFPGLPRDVHVHVCAAGSTWEREHLLFRDYLRTHQEARERYAGVKRQAARTWADDGYAYTDAKTEVVLALLAAAEDWSRLEA